MINRLPSKGAATASALLCMSVPAAFLALHTGCSSNPDSYKNPAPAIASFLVSKTATMATATSVSVTSGSKVYVKATFATNGSAVIMPGNIPVTSNVVTPIGPVTATTDYVLTVTSASGTKVTSTITVNVCDVPVITSYSDEDATYYAGLKIADNTVTAKGSTPISYSVSPQLPAGLSLNSSTGTISGTPTDILTRTAYTITALNVLSIPATKVISLTVADPQIRFKAASPIVIPGTSQATTILNWDVSAVPNLFSSVAITASPEDPALTAWLSTNTPPLNGTINGVGPTTLGTTITYTMTATAATGTLTRTTTVTAGNVALAFTRFEAPTTVYGSTSTLSWDVLGIPDWLKLDGASVTGDSTTVSPVRRQTYTLTGANTLNTATATATCKVAARGLDLLAGSFQGAGYKDSVTATSAQFSTPRQMAADAAGNIYVADEKNHVIRMISPAGAVTTLAGTAGITGTDEGTGAAARFNTPRGIAVNAAGTAIYVFDSGNKAIRKLALTGGAWVSSTLSTALTAGTLTYTLGQIILDPTEAFLAIADNGGNCIRVLRLSDNVLGIYAGSSHGTLDNTTPALAKFDAPQGIAFTKGGGYLYVSEYYSGTCSRIRMVPWLPSALAGATITPPTTGKVITIAGTAKDTSSNNKGYQDGTGINALFSSPTSLAVDANDVLYVADANNAVIRKVVVPTPEAPTVNTGAVTTYLGTAPTGTPAAPVVVTGNADGAALASTFNSPAGLLLVGSKLYISEAGNSLIRLFDGTNVSTFAGAKRLVGATDDTGAAARFNAPQGVAYYGGYAYVADTGNNLLRKVSLADGATTRIPVASGSFSALKGVATDNTGRIYVTDSAKPGLYQVAADGTLTPILSVLTSPSNVAVSPTDPNKLYVVDGNAVQEVTVVRAPDGTFTSASITKTIGSVTKSGKTNDADPTKALFKMSGFFSGLAVDAEGNIFVADEGNFAIRKIAAGTYATSTIAGVLGTFGYAEGPVNNAFGYVMGLALDGKGSLYVADQGNHAIRKIASDGTVSSLIGYAVNGVQSRCGATPGTLDQTGTAGLYAPFGLAITEDGDLLVATNDGIMQVTAP